MGKWMEGGQGGCLVYNRQSIIGKVDIQMEEDR